MNRKTLRLKGYDYSQEGFYFITVCTQNRLHLFGKIVDGEMVLNEAGCMVKRLWYEIPHDFENIVLHEFVVMPNHIHGIIEIVGAESISARMISSSIFSRAKMDSGADMESAPTGTNIPQIVQSFKRHTTLQYIKMVKTGICPPFKKRIWQRNYWEHIIRNDISYHQLISYIKNNPLKWEEDSLYS